jgi:hypothetical protein
MADTGAHGLADHERWKLYTDKTRNTAFAGGMFINSRNPVCLDREHVRMAEHGRKLTRPMTAPAKPHSGASLLLTLKGPATIVAMDGGSLKDPGWVASSPVDGDLTSHVKRNHSIEMDTVSKYSVIYIHSANRWACARSGRLIRSRFSNSGTVAFDPRLLHLCLSPAFTPLSTL